jgi:transposase-like protein
MLFDVVETIARIRREHFVKGETIKEIARDLGCPGTLFARSCDRERHRSNPRKPISSTGATRSSC